MDHMQCCLSFPVVWELTVDTLVLIMKHFLLNSRGIVVAMLVNIDYLCIFTVQQAHILCHVVKYFRSFLGICIHIKCSEKAFECF